VLERHRAILDEGDRLPVPLHRHHDIQAGLPDIPDCPLQIGLGDLDDAARQAEIGHELDQVLQSPGALIGEFHQQDRVGVAADERVHRLFECGNVASQRDHGAIDELHRSRGELDDVLRAVHRRVELREVAYPE
jgi:hypothetical protein